MILAYAHQYRCIELAQAHCESLVRLIPRRRSARLDQRAVIERRSEALLAIILAVPAEGFIPASYCVGFPIIVMLAPFGMLRPRHLYHSKFLPLLRPSNIVSCK